MALTLTSRPTGQVAACSIGTFVSIRLVGKCCALRRLAFSSPAGQWRARVAFFHLPPGLSWGVPGNSSSLSMSSGSKWRLTKKDEQEVQKVGAAAREEALAAGKTAEEADAAKTEAIEAETKRIKAGKARKSDEKRKANAKSAAAVHASKPSAEASEGQNGLYYAALNEAQETVLSHPVFKGIIADDPLPITDSEILESGVQAVWSETEAVTAVSREKCYIAGFNFWCQNIFWTPTPNVPLSKARCLEYADFTYKKPRHLDPIHIAVESVEDQPHNEPRSRKS